MCVIEYNLPFISDGLRDEFRRFPNGQIDPRTDVGQRACIGVEHEIQAGVRHVVDIEKLTPGIPRSPENDLRNPVRLRLVKFAKERGNDMRVRDIVIVPLSL